MRQVRWIIHRDKGVLFLYQNAALGAPVALFTTPNLFPECLLGSFTQISHIGGDWGNVLISLAEILYKPIR